MKNKEIVSVALKLFVITAVATLCLAVVNKVTAPVIAENALKTETEAKMEVLSAAKEFKKLSFSETDTPTAAENGVRIEEFNLGLDGDTGVGYVITAVSNAGYGGDVKVMIGLDNELKVVRAKILESSETAGLGANASKPEFINQYVGKGGGLNVVKGAASADNEISAIASATVTSRAVTSCVNGAVELMETKLAGGFTPNTVTEVNEKVEETKKATEDQLNAAQNEQTGGVQ